MLQVVWSGAQVVRLLQDALGIRPGPMIEILSAAQRCSAIWKPGLKPYDVLHALAQFEVCLRAILLGGTGQFC